MRVRPSVIKSAHGVKIQLLFGNKKVQGFSVCKREHIDNLLGHDMDENDAIVNRGLLCLYWEFFWDEAS